MNVLPSYLAMTEKLVSHLSLNQNGLENWLKTLRKKTIVVTYLAIGSKFKNEITERREKNETNTMIPPSSLLWVRS